MRLLALLGIFISFASCGGNQDNEASAGPVKAAQPVVVPAASAGKVSEMNRVRFVNAKKDCFATVSGASNPTRVLFDMRCGSLGVGTYVLTCEQSDYFCQQTYGNGSRAELAISQDLSHIVIITYMTDGKTVHTKDSLVVEP